MAITRRDVWQAFGAERAGFAGNVRNLQEIEQFKEALRAAGYRVRTFGQDLGEGVINAVAASSGVGRAIATALAQGTGAGGALGGAAVQAAQAARDAMQFVGDTAAAGIGRIPVHGLTPQSASAYAGQQIGTEVPAKILEQVPLVGSTFAALFRGVREEQRDRTFGVLERGAGRAGQIAGDLAAAGVNLSDQELAAGMDIITEQERRRTDTVARVHRMQFSLGIMQHGLSFSSALGF